MMDLYYIYFSLFLFLIFFIFPTSSCLVFKHERYNIIVFCQTGVQYIRSRDLIRAHDLTVQFEMPQNLTLNFDHFKMQRECMQICDN